MTNLIIERLFKEMPAFHAWPDGSPADWSVSNDVLRFISDLVRPGMSTLETGAGQTTVALAASGAKHVCITPDKDQIRRIQAYLEPLGLVDSVHFIQQSSDVALPSGRGVPDQLDLVLIDGAHRFPFPVLDWHYTQERVPVGGIMIVDDFRMPSVRILYDFLVGEDEWELVKAFQVTAIFRRTKKTVSVWDWADQRINKEHLERFKQKNDIESGSQRFMSLLKSWMARKQ